ncbi:MAG TPA: hypothetical protein VN629_06905, partial [Castellaniella sp.]|nr:hypothetical protein [Castellaniella sp.]
MTTKADDIKLPELPVGFFKHHIAGFDGPVYAEMQMQTYARAAVEADRQHNDTMLAHEWIRPALSLPDDAPYRFDYYAQKIGELT